MISILGKIFYGLFILLLVAVAGLFLTTLLPIPGNIEVKIVKSGSMEPAIPTGSIVIVKPIATYGVNDVITFGKDTKDQIPTTHRIISAETQSGRVVFMTKGDANEEADPIPVPASSVIGKVWFTVPYAGYVLDAARQPLGFTFMIGIPAGIIILDEMIKIWMEVWTMRRRKPGEALKEEGEKLERRIPNVPPSRAEAAHPSFAALPYMGERKYSEFNRPQYVKAGEALDLKQRLLADGNTLDLTKIWGTGETHQT